MIVRDKGQGDGSASRPAVSEAAALLTAKPGRVDIVDVPPIHAVMIDGEGDPNTAPAYQEAIAALYSVAYTLKFALKKRDGRDIGVGPLEGLWWSDRAGDRPLTEVIGYKDDWHWTMLIALPEFITEQEVTEALAEARRKKPSPALERLRFATFEEGRAAQILHVGPYAAEQPTIERLHSDIHARGYRPRGKHHEIYLGDPRRARPDRLRTIIRMPVER